MTEITQQLSAAKNQFVDIPPPAKYLDDSILYIDSGVAHSEQISACLKIAIKDAEKVLKKDTKCRFKINLLVNKEGEYFGYGYIWISCPEIYWMLLGKNPDGTERVEEYPDPNWKSPNVVKENNLKETNEVKHNENTNMNWIDIVEQEDAYVQPMIKKVLPPLVTFTGYEYDEDQIQHLKELQEDNNEIPKMGYFEISRGYAIDAPPGTLRHRICARNVPNWIPLEAFKSIFSFYIQNKDTDYPIVNFVEAKKGGKIVFITFDPAKKDAIFTLLMTKKTVLINPKNPKQTVTLIFSHAFDNTKKH